MNSDSKKQEAEQARSEIQELLLRVDSLPILDSRTEDEILGYDEQGLPR
jgi:hypothetical protein